MGKKTPKKETDNASFLRSHMLPICRLKNILSFRVHPWMIKLNMNWTLRVMGKEVALRSSDQEAAPYLRTVFRKRTCTRNATIKDRMWHQYVQVYKKNQG